MGTFVILPFKWFLSASLILFSLSANCYWPIRAGDNIHAKQTQPVDHYYPNHAVEVSSLFPTSEITCNQSPQGKREGASLEVRHRHGPCSPLKSSRPSLEEILENDEARVKSINSRVNLKRKDADPVGQQQSVELPAKSGSTVGTANFVVTVGLGTPTRDLTLAFDTGSSLTWTQCKPCAGSCYQQQDPIFDPSMSSTYANISCDSPLCGSIPSHACFSSTCIYEVRYVDKSFTIGFLAKDTLHLGLGPQDSFPNFLFGCGQDNEGLFMGIAGLLGLGRSQFSAVSQTAMTYGNSFSYCLPFNPSSTGHLTFGQATTYPKGLMYTPLLQGSGARSSHYMVDLQGIAVDGQTLDISPTIFSRVGTIIDSGTVISRLPPDAYAALREAFSKGMSNYPKAPAIGLLDTCYDLSGYTNIVVPEITLLFGGGAKLDLPVEGRLFPLDEHVTQVCLAFAGNEDINDVGIWGNVQQLTSEVVYDVAGGKLGFAPGGCT